MCGIVGIISCSGVSTELYESLLCLQHRGQDSAGIGTYSDHFHIKKGLGLVREVFLDKDIEYLKGNMGIGQVRYPTIGGVSIDDVQPFRVSSPYGIMMAHNGNVFNFWELKQELFERDLRMVNSGNDVELILNVLAYELSQIPKGDFFEALCQSVRAVHDRVRGAYSVVGMIAGKGLMAFRDPHGIRPLVWGRRTVNGKTDHIFASENTMFGIAGFEYYRDVQPGELVLVQPDGEVLCRRITEKEFRPCVFEYVYFARVDATLNGVNVYKSRLYMGENLGKKIKREFPDLDIDLVVPAPQSATTAALSCAHELGVRYSESIVKNVYIGRSFIMPGQEQRQRANTYKLSAIEVEIRGKNILVVDDSIVRGTVSRHIVQMLRNCGAKKVYFASASPPLRYPDLYGIDLPTRDEFVAFERNEDEIREFIGADLLVYQDKEDLLEAVMRKGNLQFTRPHAAYFDGDYPTGDVTEATLEEIESIRKRERKQAAKKIMKRILLIGGGAREHALGLALKYDPKAIELFVWAGNRNPGLAALAAGMSIGSMSDVQAMCRYAQNIKADFVMVGPEGPLALGLVDLLEEAGIPAIGPHRELAQLESSKTFTRELLREYAIPGSPAYRSFRDEEGLPEFLNSLPMGFVIKPDGLTGGKGVKVMGDHFNSREEGMEIIRELLAEGSQVLIEEKLVGQEFSLMSFCDGEHFLHMPAVQDHKRAFDGDTGPNTGGMGTYSMADGSLPFLQPSDIAAAKAINEAVGLALHKKCGKAYRGVLYGGFMATRDGIRLIEYNARLGDPEAMNVLSLLPGREEGGEGGNFLEICEAILSGTLNEVSILWKPLATVCKYAVPEGYPDAALKGLPLDVSEVNEQNARLFYASVEESNGTLLLAGSRAIAVLSMHQDLHEAARLAEDEISKIKGPVFHRRDVGTEKLILERVEMMQQLRKG